MKRILLACLISYQILTFAAQTEVTLQQAEIEEILSAKQPYAYFGPETGSMVHDLPRIKKSMDANHLGSDNIDAVCQRIAQDMTTAPAGVVEAAIHEAAQYLKTENVPARLHKYARNLEEYYEKLVSGAVELVLTVDQKADTRVGCYSNTQPGPLTLGTGDATSLTFVTDCTDRVTIDQNGAVTIFASTSGVALTVTGNVGNSAIVATGNGTTTAPALVLNNNPASDPSDFLVTIDSSGVVKQSTVILGDLVSTGCQAGPLTIGTSDATSLTLATNGCSSRVTVDEFGAVTIAMPSLGEALTVDGNVVLPAANGAGTQGLVQLGGTGSSNVSVYEFGTRNFFAGNGAVNSSVTGADNVSIGTNANSSLTSANNTIAVGNGAQATGTDSISVGTGANSSFARTVVLGSADSSSTGAAPTAGAVNAIAIGSAQSTFNAPVASGTASIAFGSSDGSADGALASGDHSIAVGVNATSSAAATIAFGSGSGSAAGPLASAVGALAIGSANSTHPGAIASGISAVAIGGADGTGTFDGALAAGDRSIAIGVNAHTTFASTVVIGSASGTVGGNGPTAGAANAIAIGTAAGAKAGAVANGASSVAIGSADSNGFFAGASATGDHALALGSNASASGSFSVALGSSSTGVSGNVGPVASNDNAIAIGSAAATRAGTSASGAQSVAIGGASGTVNAAAASGDRSVVLGSGANTAQADAIILGNAAATAVRVGIGNSTPSAKLHVVGSTATAPVALFDVGTVGIGTATPAAKLHVVGVAGTPVAQFAAGSAALASAPIFTNLTTSAGTTLVLTGANQLALLVSGEQYKENIRPLDDSSVIYGFKPVRFDYKNDGGKDLVGFIADDIQKLDETLVNLDEYGNVRSVRSECVQALEIRELQNQQAELKMQRTLINEQGLLINQLVAKMEELQSRNV